MIADGRLPYSYYNSRFDDSSRQRKETWYKLTFLLEGVFWEGAPQMYVFAQWPMDS
ncbi:hypothetical protein BRADI_2g62045v3 [Brachypodium distachyon]|uniref:Uncharacterized protein n=1 Tax=Brachypodium distachyon TaxID=15368 RepID=A0A2K2DHA5_BRADI|nr:hypothetical protein BRADI_2g62045v3 [Brachypodium distachyon]